MLSQNNCPGYHSLSNHNFWIARHGANGCPYCNLGSKPVHGALVDELNGNGENVVVKQVITYG